MNTLLKKTEELAGPFQNMASGETWHLLQGEKATVTQTLLDEASLLHNQVPIGHEEEPSGEIPREIEWLRRAQLEARLREIGEAQDRLIEGVYGQCIDCSEQIDRRRLAVDPAVARCVSCQSIIDGLRLH